ncbi:hypothetical protein VB620_05725 [Nodularia harveyana UHCC-0300]|uniref:Uncharacterized protein n=1 Tax=Nodularia harveyana UHCC-0300 TaxID=2974287 RepID=A0ABU5UBD0_9CYAN|nr:hypothetical protein [Nodularia harveyana UHCC-0300]
MNLQPANQKNFWDSLIVYFDYGLSLPKTQFFGKYFTDLCHLEQVIWVTEQQR